MPHGVRLGRCVGAGGEKIDSRKQHGSLYAELQSMLGCQSATPLPLVVPQEECFTSPSGKAFECKFWADSPFSISICPATGPFPQHTCQ